MNKKIMIGIVGLLLVTLVTAGAISLATWDKDISLDEDSTDRIKNVSKIEGINVEIGKIQCDEKECWATLYQKDLINTRWGRGINYCSEYNKTLDKNNETNGECLTYVDYTLDENKQALQDYLEKRLDGWSIVEEERQSKVIEYKTEVGVIKESKLVEIEK